MDKVEKVGDREEEKNGEEKEGEDEKHCKPLTHRHILLQEKIFEVGACHSPSSHFHRSLVVPMLARAPQRGGNTQLPCSVESLHPRGLPSPLPTSTVLLT